MITDKWRRCLACQATEITCKGMHSNTHVYCCTECEHPDGFDL